MAPSLLLWVPLLIVTVIDIQHENTSAVLQTSSGGSISESMGIRGQLIMNHSLVFSKATSSGCGDYDSR